MTISQKLYDLSHIPIIMVVYIKSLNSNPGFRKDGTRGELLRFSLNKASWMLLPAHL